MNPAMVTVVGGGLAGLTVGILLQRQGVPVVVYEAGAYPRHKVCGEFLSPRDGGLLERLGLNFLRAEGRQAHRVCWCWSEAERNNFSLPKPALALSRFRMDAVLAEKFVELGGKLITHHRYTGDLRAEGVVVATGRRKAKAAGWVAVKMHFHGVPLWEDVELHVGEKAYLGICRVEGDWVNVSGLFRADKIPGGKAWDELLRNHRLDWVADRLQKAELIPQSFAAVSHLDFVSPPEPSMFVIGDAWQMIPPLAGNGMSMAIESAALATEPLLAYSQSQCRWPESLARFHRLSRAAFEPRVFRARWIQRLLMNKTSRASLRQLSKSGLVPYKLMHNLLG
ncbi:MAG: NAD(P)/FAD-dependent oxidoreductase [Verrucomicrobiales bacterium]